MSANVLPTLGKVQIRRLRYQQIEALSEQLQHPKTGASMSPKAVYEIHLVIRGALADAHRRGLVTRNVADIAKAPKQRHLQKIEGCLAHRGRATPAPAYGCRSSAVPALLADREYRDATQRGPRAEVARHRPHQAQASFRRIVANAGVPTMRFHDLRHPHGSLLIKAIYTQQRPHRSLPRRATPATIYTTRPKASPANRTDPHYRVRRDRIDDSGVVTLRVAGQLHHIGIGRTLARTHVILLVDDLDVRVVDAVTGELLRALTIDTNRDYQPTGAPKGPTRPKKKRPEPS